MIQMSHEKKRACVAAFEAGMTIAEAARSVGVSPSTLKRAIAADAEFGTLVREARDLADDEVEAVTYRNCLNPDPAHNVLRMFWLKSRRRDVYGEKVAVEAKVAITPDTVLKAAEIRKARALRLARLGITPDPAPDGIQRRPPGFIGQDD